jgi:AmmeMemoRadiSam system protein B
MIGGVVKSFNPSADMRVTASKYEVRPAAVAGLFYPGSPAELDSTLDALLAGPAPAARAPKALIVPHAGYMYSGVVAGHAYRSLKPGGTRIERVVLLGPSHREWFRGLAVPQAQAFATPLGLARIDESAVARLASLPAVIVSDVAHAREHSLEVQVPFLQRLLPNAQIVPVLAGEATVAEVEAVLEALWGGPETLIVVSSDLSHYHPYREARSLDGATVGAILDGRAHLTGEDACGCLPINGLLGVAGRHGLRAELIDLRHSGDTAGDRDRVVGYGAFGFYDA